MSSGVQSLVREEVVRDIKTALDRLVVAEIEKALHTELGATIHSEGSSSAGSLDESAAPCVREASGALEMRAAEPATMAARTNTFRNVSTFYEKPKHQRSVSTREFDSWAVEKPSDRSDTGQDIVRADSSHKRHDLVEGRAAQELRSETRSSAEYVSRSVDVTKPAAAPKLSRNQQYTLEALEAHAAKYAVEWINLLCDQNEASGVLLSTHQW